MSNPAEPSPRPPVVEAIMAFFTFDHLPAELSEVSRPWCELAKSVVETLPPCAERSVALGKLLEGKDAAVRAALSRTQRP
jgi:hypothetical protein